MHRFFFCVYQKYFNSIVTASRWFSFYHNFLKSHNFKNKGSLLLLQKMYKNVMFTPFKKCITLKRKQIFFLFFFSGRIHRLFRGFPGGSVVKICLLMQETPENLVQSLGWQEPLEEEMATHSSIPALKVPWTEEPGGLPSVGSYGLWGPKDLDVVRANI